MRQEYRKGRFLISHFRHDMLFHVVFVKKDGTDEWQEDFDRQLPSFLCEVVGQ